MSTTQRWGLTAALLFWVAVITILTSAITGIWNGWALLGVLAFIGFAIITVKKD